MDEKRVALFWAKVDKSAGEDGCWLWTAGKNPLGYGWFNTGGGRCGLAHRVAWELTNGPIPAGDWYGTSCVCHRCDVPACVNPAHMFLGTQAENIADRDAKGRQRPMRGEVHGMAKLNESQIVSLRADRNAGMSYPRLGAKYGICRQHARKIALGKSWSHL